MMRIDLNNLPEYIDDADAALFDDAFEGFGGQQGAADTRGRILSSVMRKAGYEMIENNTEKKKRKHSKRFVGFVIAAAVFVTSTLCAGAYALSLDHKQSVARYFGKDAADKIENVGLALNMVQKNKHVRITADTLLSDGEAAYVVFTLEKLDYDARYWIDINPYVKYDYAGWNVGPYYGASCDYGEYGDNSKLEDSFSFVGIIKPSVLDLSSRDIKITFEGEETYPYDLFEGIEFRLDMSKNVDTISLYANEPDEEIYEDDEEKTLLLSPFGLSGNFVPIPTSDSGKAFEYVHNAFVLIRADGTRDPLVRHDITFSEISGYPYFYIFIRDYIDPNDYIGVEIDGVEYLKQ